MIQGYNYTIVDARDAGMSQPDISSEIHRITRDVLAEEEGNIAPVNYARSCYFDGTPPVTQLSEAQNILLAKEDSRIVGFLIIAKTTVKETFQPSDKPSGHLVYLAVDHDKQRSGIGTQLMLTAMQKTQALGKKYLTLEFFGSGQAERFYENFSTKYSIELETLERHRSGRHIHVFARYHLENVDFSSLVN